MSTEINNDSYILRLPAEEIEARLNKIPSISIFVQNNNVQVYESDNVVHLQLKVDNAIFDGTEIKFIVPRSIIDDLSELGKTTIQRLDIICPNNDRYENIFLYDFNYKDVKVSSIIENALVKVVLVDFNTSNNKKAFLFTANYLNERLSILEAKDIELENNLNSKSLIKIVTYTEAEEES